MRLILLTTLSLLVCICAAGQTPPLSITTSSLPRATLRHPYGVSLRASGGTPPLVWELVAGALPRGMKLEADSGRLVGTPQASGEFHFTVRVTDESDPRQKPERRFVLQVISPLTVEWKTYPFTENNNAIRGAVRVINGTEENFDLTVIIVAVNAIGKAFALGYQRLNLASQSTVEEIDFGSTLPAGDYIVHVDAVAEVPEQNPIYRARLQTPVAQSITGLP